MQPIVPSRCLGYALNVLKRPAEDHSQLVDKSRLEARYAILRHSNERCGDRLVRTSFGGKGDARRRADQNEARILIAGMIERIEPAGDERVVKRADRD